MLKIKPQGDPIEFVGFDAYEGRDGPLAYAAVDNSATVYVFSTYALGAENIDRTSAEIFLWRYVGDTLTNLLHSSSIKDPIILWRRRPSVEEENGRFIISMRCVVVPRHENFSSHKPDKPFLHPFKEAV